MIRASSFTLIAALTTGAGCSAPPSGFTAVSFPEPESAAAMLLKQRCGQCHGAPAPVAHVADHWPSVLYRMQNRMAQKGLRPLSEDELRMLTEYLKKFAKATT